MLLTKIPHWYRSRRASRAACGCPLLLIDMLGEHPAKCSNRTKDRPFSLGHVEPHQVDGILMPCAWLPAPSEKHPDWTAPSPDLSRRWCDISAAYDGKVVSRYWPADHLIALAWRTRAGWTWNIREVPQAGLRNQFDELAVLNFGDTEKLPDALDAAEHARTDLDGHLFGPA